jgi:hypothetical protein
MLPQSMKIGFDTALIETVYQYLDSFRRNEATYITLTDIRWLLYILPLSVMPPGFLKSRPPGEEDPDASVDDEEAEQRGDGII